MCVAVLLEPFRPARAKVGLKLVAHDHPVHSHIRTSPHLTLIRARPDALSREVSLFEKVLDARRDKREDAPRESH
eukprot:4912424-Pyramimonas_sp.AAC.1